MDQIWCKQWWQTIDQNISYHGCPQPCHSEHVIHKCTALTLQGQLREDNQCDWHVWKGNDGKFQTSLLRVPCAFLEAAVRTLAAHIPHHHQLVEWDVARWWRPSYRMLKKYSIKLDRIGSSSQGCRKSKTWFQTTAPPICIERYMFCISTQIISNPRFQLMQWVAQAPSDPRYGKNMLKLWGPIIPLWKLAKICVQHRATKLNNSIRNS